MKLLVLALHMVLLHRVGGGERLPDARQQDLRVEFR
jgi:hypothetical protein